MRVSFSVLIFSFFLCLFAGSHHAYAQNDSSLGGYVPPPLFAEPKIPTHEERKSNNIAPHLPVISPEVDAKETEIEGEEPLIKGRIFKQEKDEEPTEPKKFYSREQEKEPEQKSTSKALKAPVPAEKPAASQQPVAKQKEPEKAIPKVSHEGVVKGPKTMPAVQKKEVDTETTFETSAQKPGEILDRVQEEAQKTIEKAEPPASEKPVSAIVEVLSAQLTSEPDGSRKFTMTYLPLQEELTPEHISVLDGLIIPELDKNVKIHLLLQSYASPMDGVLSGDRRISLGRALAIRDYLINQAIAPERIYVRSLGNVGDIEPQDRVELYLVK